MQISTVLYNSININSSLKYIFVIVVNHHHITELTDIPTIPYLQNINNATLSCVDVLRLRQLSIELYLS